MTCDLKALAVRPLCSPLMLLWYPTDEEAFALRRDVRLLKVQLSTCSSTASAITDCKCFSPETQYTVPGGLTLLFPHSLSDTTAEPDEGAAGVIWQWFFSGWVFPYDVVLLSPKCTCFTVAVVCVTFLSFFFLPVLQILSLNREVAVLEDKLRHGTNYSQSEKTREYWVFVWPLVFFQV